MDLELSDDQFAMRDAIRSLLAGRFPMERVREGFDRSMFDDLAEAGVFMLLHDGFAWADAVVVFEQLGAALVPGPLAWNVLARSFGDGAVGPGVTVGGLERPGAGASAMVEHFDALDVLAIHDARGVELVDVASIYAEPLERPLDPLTPVWRAYAVPEGEQIERAGQELAHEWNRRGAVLTASYLLGIADRLTELSVEYAKERVQFGRPIGSFQAVKHLCADMLVRTEVARAAVYAAGVHLDAPELPGLDRAVSTAKVCAGDAAITNGKVATQVHGGMGFTWEVDVHLYLKRAWVLDTHFGSVDAHCDARALA